LNVSVEIKKQCVKLHKQGKTAREIYTEYYSKQPNIQVLPLNSFKRTLRDWQHKVFADDVLLEAGNLGYGYTPTRTTVQVNRDGEVVQAWIKSHSNDDLYLELIEEVKRNTPHKVIEITDKIEANGLLELGFVDMHFGIADLDFYKGTLIETLGIIHRKTYKEIVIPIGNDLFHNDNFKGETTKGTLIEKINLPKSWNDAKSFFYNVIDTSIEQSESVKIIYVPGNHDYTVTWAFIQMLKERYGDIVDDSLDEQKVITYGSNFIGLTHGEKGKNRPYDLARQFSMRHPVEFYQSKVKEIHAGHLHSEQEKDEYGVMCRRLSTGNKDDEWTINQGYISTKRFMVFEWSLDKLTDIHYV
jgi:hypothetical protein